MPLFGNKFSPKKVPPRKYPSLSNLNLDASEKHTEFGPDQGPIKIRLGSNEILFDGGEWIAGKFHWIVWNPDICCVLQHMYIVKHLCYFVHIMN